MKTSLDPTNTSDIRALLGKANRAFTKNFPGESDQRQPVHTVYGGAQLFKADTARKMGAVALKSLREFAPDPDVLARVLGYDAKPEFARRVYERVVEKLTREPVEDFRIDFEDGYGNRPDAEEDGHAQSSAGEVVLGMKNQTLAPFIGIRIKPFSEELFARSSRTMDLFISTMLEKSGGKLPGNFVITIPKVVIPEQVTALDGLLSVIEEKTGLAHGVLKIELMIEMPQAIIDSDGRSPLPALVRAGRGRVTGVHFGTYDYTAGCSITATHQRMDHPACDFAKNVMQVSLAQTGIMLSDGATNVMPVGPSADGIHRAWKLAYDHIRHSLVTAYYQGWDLHPAQLPVRYAAVYSFFLEGFEPAAARLKAFMDKAAQATLLGDVFDDAATGQGLLNFFLRAINCGAITEEEARVTGLTLEEIRARSFLKILDARRGKN